ncbi:MULTISPECIES: M15 family metallopeptidase [Brevibacterium]|jgi:D-alanyl-D-alanine carboxypeptidase|uniref:D-alanyl-D-alanine carboxypeptidase-like core domain-containing protein n=1 Tax=Brevibacterium salitolerans TaxID=1403566 RepID=A0ABP5I297_9MICO|nr:M15 family metallopeptidase [Brevibacterium sp.]
MAEGTAEQVFTSRRARREAEGRTRRETRRTFRTVTEAPASAQATDQVNAGTVAFRGSDGSVVRSMRRRRAATVSALTSVSAAGVAIAAVLVAGNGTGQAQAAEAPAEDAPRLTALDAESVSADVAEADVAVGSTASGSVPSAEGGKAEAAGRSITKTVLPGCSAEHDWDANVSNGQLPEEWLCDLGIGKHQLRADAAVAFAKMNAAYKADTGKEFSITDSYRSLEGQISVAGRKPGLSARPGTSLHGWGIALDLGGGVESESGPWNWLVENAGDFGWENPDWAKSSKYEPWHWEYVPARETIKGH